MPLIQPTISAVSTVTADTAISAVTAITNLQHFSNVLSTDKRFVLIDFKAAWCGPCRAIAPFVEQLAASELSDFVAVYSVDVDTACDVAEYCTVSAMPTFMLYKDSVKIGEVTGANKQAIISLLSRATNIRITA